MNALFTSLLSAFGTLPTGEQPGMISYRFRFVILLSGKMNSLLGLSTKLPFGTITGLM